MSNLFLGGFLPFISFILLHAARPFFMGLYHDDWYLLTMPHRMPYSEIFPNLYSGFIDRPIFNFIAYAAILSWDGRPETLTLGSSIIVGITSYILYIFLKTLTDVKKKSSLAASIGTTFWILIPWGFGYSLWPIGTMTLLGTIFFLISAIFCVKFFKTGNFRYLSLYGILLLFSFFSYQSNYFAFIPLIGLIIALLGKDKFIYQRGLYLLIVGVLAQLTSIIYTKFVSIKTLSISLKFIFGNFLYALPYAIIESFGKYWWIPFCTVIVIIASFIMCISNIERKNKSDLAKAILICFVGIAIGTLPYSAAGYMLKGLGVFSRTTITANLWLAIMTCVVIIYLDEIRNKFRNFVLFAFLILLLTFAIASANQSIGWALSWKRQNEILKNFPVDALLKMGSGSVIILNEPDKISGVEVFAASWDVSNAVYEKLRPIVLNQDIPPQILPIREGMVWDGVSTLQISQKESIKTKELWIYTPNNQTLKRVLAEGHIN